MNDSSCVFEIIFNTMQQSHNTISIKTLCEMAGVSRSGYYAWVKAAPTRELKEQQDRDDFDLILAAYKMHGYTKGAKGIYMALLHMDPPVIMNLKKIRRLMDKFNLSCPYRGPNPYRRMAKALKTSNVADNLLQREFEAYGPRIVLLTDITYLPTDEGWLYMAAVMDLWNREIVSYRISRHMSLELVKDVVSRLGTSEGTLIHSDMGWTYTHPSYISHLKELGFRQSMSRKGNCWDNACMENFFGLMKSETIRQLKELLSVDEMINLIDDYIHWYNNQRIQKKLGYLSPCDFRKWET